MLTGKSEVDGQFIIPRFRGGGFHVTRNLRQEGRQARGHVRAIFYLRSIGLSTVNRCRKNQFMKQRAQPVR